MADWFVIHIRSGQEKNVRKFLELLREEHSEIMRVVLPVEQVAEMVEGKKKLKSQFFMPGYLLLELEPNEEVWHLIKTTPGILGVLGGKETPAPLSPEEVRNILAIIEERKEKPAPRFDLMPGNQVEIREGPFKDFSGIVEEVSPEKEKVKVSVSIFGRSTIVELDVLQVEKI
jgi:transcriptional antiterminator NusG